MKCNYKIVLFDLDGTLCESGEGILNSAKYAIREMGFPVPPPEVMRKFIGPPMGQSMRNFCGMSQEQAEKGPLRCIASGITGSVGEKTACIRESRRY